MKRTRVILLTLLVGISVNLGAAWAESVDGTWEGTWTWTTFSGRLVLRLTQNGDEVHGTYDVYGGRQGDQTGVAVKGSFKGDRLILAVPSNPQSSFDVVVKGDEMSGTFRGRTALNTFTAKRSK